MKKNVACITGPLKGHSPLWDRADLETSVETQFIKWLSSILIHTYESTVGSHPPRAYITTAIQNGANNGFSVIGRYTPHVLNTHDTTFPPFLQTTIEEKEIILRERLINTL